MKRIGKIKRAATLGLIFLLSINNFATSVANNDGSAFITKAEFDALKSSFQAQIDTYNQDIDSKIDAAIASYLTGIKISKTETSVVLLNNIDSFTLANKAPTLSHGLPEWNWVTSAHGKMYDTLSSSSIGVGHAEAYGMSIISKYAGTYSTMNLVNCFQGSQANYNSTTSNKFAWLGRTEKFMNHFIGALVGHFNDSDAPNAQRFTGFNIYKAFYISPGNAYYSNNANGWNDYFSQQVYYTISDPAYVNFVINKDYGFYQTTISYENSTLADFDNFGTLQDVSIEVSEPTFDKCYYQFSSQNKTDATLGSSATTAIEGSICKFWGEGNSMKGIVETVKGHGQLTAHAYANAYGSTGYNRYLPTVGGLGGINSHNIYLSSTDYNYTFHKETKNLGYVMMDEGFPVLYATKGTKIEWPVTFSKVTATTDGVATTDELNVVLSLGKFTNGFDCNNNYINASSRPNVLEPYITTGKKATIKWTMPDDGFVFAKWYPSSKTATTALSCNYWYAVLDVSQSNKFDYVLPDE